jgi:transketolase C-terminal domain/subunit
MSSAVMEALVDATGWIGRSMRRLGMRDGFAVVNGDRDHLHRLYGVDTPDIVRAAEELVRSA